MGEAEHEQTGAFGRWPPGARGDFLRETMPRHQQRRNNRQDSNHRSWLRKSLLPGTLIEQRLNHVLALKSPGSHGARGTPRVDLLTAETVIPAGGMGAVCRPGVTERGGKSHRCLVTRRSKNQPGRKPGCLLVTLALFRGYTRWAKYRLAPVEPFQPHRSHRGHNISHRRRSIGVLVFRAPARNKMP